MTLNGNTKTTTGSSLTFNVPNGTFSYTVGGASRYSTPSDSGTITVNGAGNTVSLAFAQKEYTLTITQKGLPYGDNWTATVGGKTYNSTTSAISVELTVGNYNISVSSQNGYTVSMTSHNVTMGAANQSFAVSFSSGSSGSLAGSGVYASIGAAAVIGGAVGVFSTMLYTGTGFFRKKKL